MASSKTMAAVRAEGIRKMTIPERASLERELGEIKLQLNPPRRRGEETPAGDPTESRPDLLQNRPHLMGRKRQIEELLNKDDDLVARGGGQRKALELEAKAIEDRVGKGMLTERQRMYRMGRQPQDYEIAVQMTVYQQRHHLTDLQRWQEIQRQLHPEDPTACDVRNIKPR